MENNTKKFNLISASYILIATFTLLLIFYNAVTSGSKQVYFGFILSLATFVYIYLNIIKNYAEKKSLLEILRPVIVFNFLVLLLFYISSFEMGIPRGYFRVSFTFGNFMDFATMPDTYVRGSFDWVATGHFPFAYAISKAYATALGWMPNSNINFSRIRNSYILIYILATIPLIMLIKNTLKDMRIDPGMKIIYWAFFLISYPIFVSFERGNLAFLAASLLALYVINYQRESYRLCSIIIGVAAAIKTLNLIFLLLVLSKLGLKNFMISIFTFAGITIASLFYLYGVNFSEWMIFKSAILAPINSPIIISDANKILCNTGWDSARSLILALYNNVKSDIISQSAIFSKALIAAAIIFLCVFYKKVGRRGLWYQEALFVLTLPLIFHSASGDYNLLLLVPFIVLLMKNHTVGNNSELLVFYSIPFLLVSGLTIYDMTCCGDGLGRAVSVSIKSILVPYSLTVASVLILRGFRLN